jgi:SAM-dependent methyltransferase
MSARPWNHNIHYHDFVLRTVPPGSRRALDVGCGTGLLARRLAERCDDVVAIDADKSVVSDARTASLTNARITFIEGDAMTHPFVDGSFDFIAAVAVLHHLPLRPALERFQSLLRVGGVVVVIGLYRPQTPQDYAWAAAALPASWMLRRVHRFEDVAAPLREPGETLYDIRRTCDLLLPGSHLRRRLLFRYSLTWRKP